MGDGEGNEGGEVVLWYFEGPAPEEETGAPQGDGCFIDSSIAFLKSSSSWDTIPNCCFDSFSERAIAIFSASSSSSTGARLTSPSNLGGEPAGNGGGGADKGGETVSYGESYNGDESDRYEWPGDGIGIDGGGGWTGEMR